VIKINLALRKSASSAVTGSEATRGTLTKIPSVDVSGLPVKQVVFALVVYFGADDYFGQAKQSLLNELGTQQQTQEAKRADLQKALSKFKQYEDLKKALDADQKLVSNKLETILKLNSTRGSDVKTLQLISRAIPTEVWLANLTFSKTELVFKGSALDFNLVSDFMKKLSDSDQLADVQLENSTEGRDDRGSSVATFDLKAKRK